MTDVPNDPKHDPLERFLREARPEAPEGLADRLLAAATDPEVQAKLYWAEAAETAGRALILSAAGLLLSAGALAFSYTRPLQVPSAPSVATTEPTKTTAVETPEKTTAPDDDAETVELDEVTDPLQLALNTELTQLASDYPLLQGGR